MHREEVKKEEGSKKRSKKSDLNEKIDILIYNISNCLIYLSFWNIFAFKLTLLIE